MTQEEHIQTVMYWRRQLSDIMISVKSCPIPSKYIMNAYEQMLEARFFLGELLKGLNGYSPYNLAEDMKTANVNKSLNEEDTIPFTDKISTEDTEIIMLKQIRAALSVLISSIFSSPPKQNGKYNIFENQAAIDLTKARAYLGMVFSELDDIKLNLKEFEAPKTIGLSQSSSDLPTNLNSSSEILGETEKIQ